MAHKTASLQIAGIRHHLRVLSRDAFDGSFHIRKVLKGYSVQRKSTSKRKEISYALLQRFSALTRTMLSNPYMTKMFQAAMFLAFHALLRPGECFTSQHVLHRSDVTINGSEITLRFRTSKSAPNGPAQFVTISSAEAASYLSVYLQVRPPGDGPLFTSILGVPITTQAFTAFLRKLCVLARVPPGLILPHSFRIGGATFLALAGVPQCKIMVLGRWKSGAVRLYIRI